MPGGRRRRPLALLSGRRILLSMSSQSERRVSFDIEIANVFELGPGEDLDEYGPFDISCAAAADDRGEVVHWTSTAPDGSRLTVVASWAAIGARPAP